MASRRIVTPAAPAPAPDSAEKQAVRRVAARELARRQRLPKAVAALLAGLHPRQRALVEDKAKYIATCAGRRSGKTHALVALALVVAAAHPGCTIPIVERTLTCQAARVFWKALQDIDAAYGLGIVFNHSLLRATLPNGAELVIVGANTVDEADKLRGNKFPLAIVDEAGTFRVAILEYLIHEVLEPALMDWQGRLVLSGTPAPRRAGPFYLACTNPEMWSFHHWTFRENDALPLACGHLSAEERAVMREAWFAELLKRNGWTEDSPWVRREYLGIWEEDANGRIYRIAPVNHDRVTAPDLTKGDWRFGLGIDFGYDPDPCAFVVVAWRRGDPWLYVLESFERPRLIPSAVAAVVDRLRVRYKFAFIVGDMGGYGKGPAEEMRQRYNIPITAAKKRGKEAHVGFVNGDLASGIIRIVPESNEDLISDLYGLRRAEGAEWAEDERDDNHLPDAFLYACHEQRSTIRGLGDPDGAEPGSREWQKAREDALEARMVEAHKAAAAPAADAFSQAVHDVNPWGLN